MISSNNLSLNMISSNKILYVLYGIMLIAYMNGELMGLGYDQMIVDAMLNTKSIPEPTDRTRYASLGIPLTMRSVSDSGKLVSKRGYPVMPDGLVVDEVDTYGVDSTDVNTMNQIIQDKIAQLKSSDKYSDSMRRVGLKALEKLNKVNMRIKDTTNGGKSPGRKGFYSSKRDQIVLSDKEDPEMLQYIADHEMTHGLNAGALLNFYRKPNGGHYDNRINEDLARMFSIRKNLPGKYKDTSDKDNYIHPVFFYNTKEKRFMNAGNGMLRASRAGRTKRRRPGAINKNYVQA